MKKILFIFAFLFIILSVQAQDSKAERKAAQKLQKEKEKREQEMIDKQLYEVALQAIKFNQWAFESDRLTDSNGMTLNVNTNRPNVAGFDGKRFFSEIIYPLTFKNPRGENVVSYHLLQMDSNAKTDGQKIDKKGNHVYKFISHPPTAGQITLTLYKDTNRASIAISSNIASVNYIGKVIPIKDSWYFMTYEK